MTSPTFLVGFGMLVAIAGVASGAGPPARSCAERVRTDLFGDPLPPGALARAGTVRFAHGDATSEYPALAADHKTFATVSTQTPYRKGKVVCLWDAESGKELRHLLDPDFEPYHAFFLKTETLLGTVSNLRKPGKGSQYAIQFWNPRTGEKVGLPICTGPKSIWPLVLSADERWIASASWEPPVVVRERKTGRVVATWKGPGGRIDYLAFAPDGKTLAIVCGSTLHLWDWKAGRETGRLDDMSESVGPLWFSPDGKWLAAAIGQKGLRIWKAKNLAEVRRFPGQNDIRFFPDGKRLVSTDTGMVWDVISGKKVGQFERCAHCATLEFSADGKVATGYAMGRIRRWDAATGKDRSPPTPLYHQMMIHQVGFLPGGKAIVSASPDGAVRLWDAATGKKLPTLVWGTTWDAKPTYMRVAPDGTIVVARGDRLSFFKEDGQSTRGKLTAFPEAGLASLNVSSDGKHLILAGERAGKSLVQLWDLHGRKPLGQFTPPEGTTIDSLAISREGAVAACVGDEVCILNGRTGVIERTLDRRPPDPPPPPNTFRGGDRGHSWFHGIQALTFSPDGALLASAGHPSGGLKLLDVASGKTRHVLLPATAGGHYQLHNVVFSPDGRMVASESDPGVVDVWEVGTGRRRRRFRGHRSYQTTLAFSPNGRQLASGNRDTTILVWDVFGQSTGRVANLAALWTGLIDADAERACLAMGNLMRTPESSVPFLGRHLLGRKDTAALRIKGWIVDLDSDVFSRRERASRELAKHFPSADPLLREALAAKPSSEVRGRIKRLLLVAGLQHPSPTTLRDLRAVEVLEHSGSPAAREVLRRLTGGEYDPWVASAAGAAARRLSAMPR